MTQEKIVDPAAGPVTVQRVFDLGCKNLFAVQAGVPIGDALDALSMLLGTARELTIACELNGSIQNGLSQHQRAATGLGRD